MQDTFKLETASLKARAADLEAQVLELRIQVNQKVSGTELAEIVDKKLQVVQEYKKDTAELNKKCNDMRLGLQSLGLHPHNEGSG